MRIYTKIVMDWNGNIIQSESYDYSGPIAKCDRSLEDRAKQAQNTATSTAGNYGAEGSQVQADLVPRLEKQAVNPEGYDPIGLGDMESGALQTAGAATGAASENMRLRAMRTGNAAGVNAGEAAAAEGAARSSGSALQSILAKNAELKANQANQANQGLEGILGEDVKGQTENARLVPEDINSAANASNQGWLQNTTGVLKALQGAGASGGGKSLTI